MQNNNKNTKVEEQEAIKILANSVKKKINESNSKIDESISINTEDGTSVSIDNGKIEVNKDNDTVVVEKEGTTPNMGTPEETMPMDTEDEESTETLFEIKTITEIEQEEMIANPFATILKKLEDIEKKMEGGNGSEGEIKVIDDEDQAEVAPEMPTEEPAPAPEPAPTEQPTENPEPEPIQEFKIEEYNDMEDNDDNMVDEIMNEFLNEKDEDDDSMTDETMDNDDMITIVLTVDPESGDCDCETADDVTDEINDEDDMDMDSTMGMDSEDEDSVEIDLGDEESADDTMETDDMEDEPSEDDDELKENNDDAVEIDLSPDDNMPSEDEDLDEMLGVGLITKQKDRPFTPHVPHKEMNEIKAQYESKLDELIKENKSLKRDNSGLKKDVLEYQDSFAELRNSIDEMQTFNAKLALANKVFLTGGFSTDEKLKINEAFDQATSIKDAEKICQKLLKEGVHKINIPLKNKVTNVPQGTKPAFESGEAKVLKENSEKERGQLLAGIIKREE